jgi:hypothetical protein
MDSVWVIEGQTGEYRDSWYVGAFATKAEADEYLEELEAWGRENKVHRSVDRADASDHRGLQCPLDAHFRCDYTGTGTDWFVVEVPFGRDGIRLADGKRRLRGA